MGQSQQIKAHIKSSDVETSLRYDVDIHLIELDNVLPSTFSYPTQKLIAEIEQLASQINEHPIEKYLISSLEQRFNRIDEINQQAFHLGKNCTLSNKKEQVDFSELRNKQQFLKLINKLQRTYLIELKIEQEYEGQVSSINKRSDSNSSDTLRKQMLPFIEGQDIDQELIMRLIIYYYLKMFKLNIHNHSQTIMKFHTDTGRMLCLLIFNHYLEIEQLFQIFYHLVCVDKQGQATMKKTVSKLHQQYHPMCLKYSHSINLSSAKMQVIQTATRIYLDQLYFKSLEEAEDPQIKNTDDSLMPIKVFPISRVKDKQK